MARRNSITERQAKIDAIVDCVISMAEMRSEGAPDCEPADTAAHILHRAGENSITSDAMAAAAAALRKSPVHTAYCRQVADLLAGTADNANPAACPQCGHIAQGNGEPVTVGGWHGDIYYGWGRYAGVHMCQAVMYRCDRCGVEWSANPNWDK